MRVDGTGVHSIIKGYFSNEETNANTILGTETFTISISISVTLGDNDYAHNQPKNLSRVRF